MAQELLHRAQVGAVLEGISGYRSEMRHELVDRDPRETNQLPKGPSIQLAMVGHGKGRP